MSPMDADIAHLLAGSLVLVSFLLLYQDRMFALLNIFALHACVLACSVGWQAWVQGAPHLFITALIALRVQGRGHSGRPAPHRRAPWHPRYARERRQHRSDDAALASGWSRCR